MFVPKMGWESLPNVEDVTCSMEQSGYGTLYTVEFNAFPALPYQNNIFEHFGNPGATSFSCDISKVCFCHLALVFRVHPHVLTLPQNVAIEDNFRGYS